MPELYAGEGGLARWDAASGTLHVPVDYLGTRFDDEAAKADIARQLEHRLYYAVSEEAALLVPPERRVGLRLAIDLQVTDDVLGPLTQDILNRFAQFCDKQGIVFSVTAVERQVLQQRLR